MPKVLLVSPYFPPSSVAGVHRARHLANHLAETGWSPIVLCVDETAHEERLDPALAALVRSDVEIVKVGAWSARWTRPFGFGDISLRAWPHLRRGLFEILQTRHPDVVLITGSPYYPMLLAPAIRKHGRVPVVLDFQDPWVSEWGAAQPLLSKAGLSHLLATILEPKALRGAAFVTSVSDRQNRDLATRHPRWDAGRMAAIPIGGDPADFEMLRRMRPTSYLQGSADTIHLSYVGSFLPRAGELVRTLFRAYRALRTADASLAARIRMNFIGTSNQSHSFKALVMPIAAEEGVAAAVHEVPQRIPYLDALGVLAASQGILLIGSDEPHYTASKIYPALMSGRPYLSLFHDASSAHAILSAAGGGRSLSFTSAGELARLGPSLTDGLRILASEPHLLGKADPASYADFDARRIARRFAEIFDDVAGRRPV